MESIPFNDDSLVSARRREVDAFARWVAGEIPGHHQDAHLCIQTQEIMMAIYESARTHSLVELPLKTQASPLIAMINEGTLPIRSPGWHDIRHRTGPQKKL